MTEEFMKNSQFEISSHFKSLNLLNQTRLRNRQKATNVVFFANVKVKIIHDKRHKFLFLNSKRKVFLRLHKEYNLSRIINRKLSQQRCVLVHLYDDDTVQVSSDKWSLGWGWLA
jgi:hypothetical protein